MVSPTDNSAVPRDADALLRARRSPANGERDDAPSRHLAWQREMERAQLADWFKPGGTATAQAQQPSEHGRGPGASDRGLHGLPERFGTHRPTNRAAPEPASVLPARAEVRAPAPAGMHVATASVVQAWQGTSSLRSASWFDAAPEQPIAKRIPLSTVSRDRSNAPTPDEVVPEMIAAEETASEVSESLLVLREPLQPLRLYEEATAHGQAVWVAMHADDATLAALLPAIVGDLRSGLHAQGRRLYQVVCNGQLVWRDEISSDSGERSATGMGQSLPDFNMFDSIHSKEA